MSGDNRGPDDSRPAITASRIAAILTASASAAIGAALAAIRALTPAADKAIYFTSASAAALMDMPATARTFLASFPAPTLAAALAMSAQKITGLARGTATGEAITWDDLIVSTPWNAYDYSTWTVDTPTNITELLLTGANGPILRMTSATASNRAGGRYTVGTRIRSHMRGGSRRVGGATLSGQAIYLLRPGTDNRRIVMTVTSTYASGLRLYVMRFTDKDTFGVTLLDATINHINPVNLWLESRDGNTTAAWSMDGGQNWETVYTATDATAFGTAGAGTHVGICAYNGANNSIVNAYAPYLLVEA